MKLFGLKPSEMQEMKKLFQTFFGDLEDTKVYLFGSRATGQHKEFSDIDIAVNSKSKDLSKRISLFNEGWEKSKLPYKVDITSWKDIYKPYLPQIRKEKVTLWKPEDQQLHPWRPCPYGQHWVIRHPRNPVGRGLQDVDGHCRKNPSGKDRLDGDEIEIISNMTQFKDSKNLPLPYSGIEKIKNPNEYDILIAGWCTYWNDIFKPETPIDSNFIKALMESESRFKPNASANNKKTIGQARGLIQITEATLRILKDRKGEIKDNYIDISKEELFTPSKNICAATRWLFRKKEILQKRLGRSPTWPEVVVEYKGLGPGLKKKDLKSTKVLNDFLKIYETYK